MAKTLNVEAKFVLSLCRATQPLTGASGNVLLMNIATLLEFERLPPPSSLVLPPQDCEALATVPASTVIAGLSRMW
jgi:hypothetical protein